MFDGINLEETDSVYKLKCIRSDVVVHLTEESIEAAAQLCPNVELISISNARMQDETLIKLTLFQNLRELCLTNNEYVNWTFNDDVAPILMCSGSRLRTLVLTQFNQVDVTCKYNRRNGHESIFFYIISSPLLAPILELLSLW